MKIAFSATVLDQGKSGIYNYIRGLLNALGDLDKSNHYQICLAQNERLLLPSLPGNFQFNEIPIIQQHPILSILWQHFVFPLHNIKEQFDLLYIPTMRRIPLIKCCPIMATIHDIAPLIFAKKYGLSRNIYHQHFLKRAIHNCDRLTAVSHATKQDIVNHTDYPENKIAVIYPGINHSLYHLYPKSQAKEYISSKYQFYDPFIVYISRLEYPNKNHLALIEAFTQFKQQQKSPHKLILAGAKWNGADKILNAMQASPFASDILYLDFVPNEALPYLYASADLMVFPSLFEGFGLPIIEALACGAKVACSNTSSMKEIGTGYAALFTPHEPEDIADKITIALSQPLTPQQLEKQLAYASTFNWESTAKAMLSQFQAVKSILY